MSCDYPLGTCFCDGCRPRRFLYVIGLFVIIALTVTQLNENMFLHEASLLSD